MRNPSRLALRSAPLPQSDIDTDQIIPKQYLTTVERTGLGRGLFHDLRRHADGTENPDFVLNQPAFRGAEALVAGANFGCGSSREHAVWALLDFGVRVVVSSSFGEIFHANCLQNGLLAIELDPEALQRLLAEIRPGARDIVVDLDARTLTSPAGAVYSFQIDEKRRRRFLEGSDEIAETLDRQPAIAAFEAGRARRTPWLETSLPP